MRGSPFQTNSITNKLDMERQYAHHKRNLKKIKEKPRPLDDTLDNMIAKENSLIRTRNFEKSLDEM